MKHFYHYNKQWLKMQQINGYHTILEVCNVCTVTELNSTVMVWYSYKSTSKMIFGDKILIMITSSKFTCTFTDTVYPLNLIYKYYVANIEEVKTWQSLGIKLGTPGLNGSSPGFDSQCLHNLKPVCISSSKYLKVNYTCLYSTMLAQAVHVDT